MLVAVSGSQGSGKTTVLSQLKNRMYNYTGKDFISKVIDRKTSRSILSDWGVSLEEVNANPSLTIRFQNEIIIRKYDDERQGITSSDLWYTERTYADLFTYALISLGKDNKYSSWLDQYFLKCMRFQHYYDHVYYLKAGQFGVVGDGVRGANKHYSRMVDLTMLDYTKRMTQSSRLEVIETSDIEERVAVIATRSERAHLHRLSFKTK